MKQRELRFRAWFNRTNDMVYNVKVSDSCAVRLRPGQSSFAIQYDPTYEEADQVMQYTGLRGKGDVEVWEGDIIEYNAPIMMIPKITIVVWRNGMFYLKTPDNRGYHQIHQYLIDECNVLGNIFENPELNTPLRPDRQRTSDTADDS